MTTTFDTLPDDARLWVFVLSRPLAAHEVAAFQERMAPFLDGWTSHSRPVQAALQVLGAQVALVGATIPGGDVSGCGIDKLVRHLETTLADVGASLASSMDVAYRDPDGTWRLGDRPTLKRLVQDRHLAPDTPLLDASITSVGAWRSGALERPLTDTWMARYLATPAR